MAKSPTARKDTPRPDRQTRIASGPVPAPIPGPTGQHPAAPSLPTPPPVGNAPARRVDATVPAPGGAPAAGRGPGPRPTNPVVKRTQMLSGANPPAPELFVGGTTPKAPPVAAPARGVTAPPPNQAAPPSIDRTVVGPAPAPPVPTPSANPGTGVFGDDAELDGDTLIPRNASTGGLPTAARDTTPGLGGGASPTDPGRNDLAGADTHYNLASEARRATEGGVRAPTTAISSRRSSSRASTQMHGTEGLSAPSADAPKIRLVPGRVIPGTRYEIRRWLGEGGMGVVYEVSHVDIERRSALKILRFDLSQQPQMAQVFRDEARAASRLGCPNIVEVYDFGELPDGRLFFAMELLEGRDLVPPDEQTAMDPARLIAILRQTCKGLARAHEAGVVHRDVKPENIICCELDERTDTVKIVDFGISAMLAAGETKAGIAGTPQYMAPEQILGENFDGRLDVYALGCMAYELMVGVPPFDAEDVEEVLKLQVNAPPLPPSQRRPDLKFPAELEAVILKCLAKHPHERYPDMAHLEAALCEAQIAAGIRTAWDDLPVPLLPDDARRQKIVARMPSATTAPTAKRSWLWPIVAVMSSAAAVGLGAFLLFGGEPTDEEKNMVDEITQQARNAASRASWVIPPPTVDSSETALLKVQELEQLEGSAEDMGDERGAQLREEFSATLMTHGDELWDVARDFSRQYYIWALMFDRDNERALERANIDILTLDDFRRRALAGDFNDMERMLAGTAALDVVEDPEEREALTVAVAEGMQDPDAMSPLARASMERSFEKRGVSMGRGRRGSGVGRGDRDAAAAPPVAAEPEPVVEDEPEPEPEPVIEDEPEPAEDPKASEARKKRRNKVTAGLAETKATRDPERSKALTADADAKRKQGHRGDAKTLYGQAIAADPMNGSAHLGLALVHFDQGAYHKARKAAARAVRHMPKSALAQKTLGDAFFKELRYQEALDAYQKAQALGANVGGRIADVKHKLGK